MSYTSFFRFLSVAGLGLLAAAPENAAEVRRLTLTEAVHLAISQNHALKIARLKVVEHDQKKAGERSAYFPQITNQSNALRITELQNIVLPAGALGTSAGALIPPQSITVQQGQKTLLTSGT